MFSKNDKKLIREYYNSTDQETQLWYINNLITNYILNYKNLMDILNIDYDESLQIFKTLNLKKCSNHSCNNPIQPRENFYNSKNNRDKKSNECINCMKLFKTTKHRNQKESKRLQTDPNEFVEHDNYFEMILYDQQGFEKYRAKINKEDKSKVEEYKWHATFENYVLSNRIFLHRLILNMFDMNILIDHKDRNPLNNMKENLRVCTASQNRQNIKIPSNNQSGVIGVFWDSTQNRWLAKLSINGNQKYLGHYTIFEDAVKARKKAELEYFGEFINNK